MATATTVTDLATIRQQAEEAFTYLDIALATELQAKLEDVLAGSGLDQKTFAELDMLLAKVKFVRFTALTDREQFELVESYLPVAYTLPNYDLKAKIGRCVLYLADIDDKINLMEG
jgi:hypothetical protein